MKKKNKIYIETLKEQLQESIANVNSLEFKLYDVIKTNNKLQIESSKLDRENIQLKSINKDFTAFAEKNLIEIIELKKQRDSLICECDILKKKIASFENLQVSAQSLVEEVERFYSENILKSECLEGIFLIIF